ncbi:EthD domain-containing protein [Pseudomonas sp. MYb185]|uniref:EthD domain-containing protein n=1 Tax=Pseudomonas sp. MYb185 TaxID=1848729 RepID=UPI000CFB832E|nr:EthD domain-containing protein [Pseudomonas sp. MYb185]PRB84131.1 hypothetical protein CQ007_04720 [Pseudomonas sp. MYb185]
MTKVFTLLHRRSGWSGAQFSEYWATIHKEHALDLAREGFFTGYIQNHLISDLRASGWPAADGIPEIWTPTADSLAELAASELYQQGAAKDEPNFTSGKIVSYVGDEGPERVLGVLSCPTPGIRHLLFAHADSQRQFGQITGILEQCNQGRAADVYSISHAAGERAQGVLCSGFWDDVKAAQQGVSVLASLLLQLPGVRPLNAGLYKSMVIVRPQCDQRVT